MTKDEMKETIRRYMQFVESLVDTAEDEEDLEFLEEIVDVLESQLTFFSCDTYFREH